MIRQHIIYEEASQIYESSLQKTEKVHIIMYKMCVICDPGYEMSDMNYGKWELVFYPISLNIISGGSKEYFTIQKIFVNFIRTTTKG